MRKISICLLRRVSDLLPFEKNHCFHVSEEIIHTLESKQAASLDKYKPWGLTVCKTWQTCWHTFIWYLFTWLPLLCLKSVYRIIVLSSICGTQAFMMWKFINFQLRRWREHSSSQPQSLKKKFVTTKGRPSKKERGLYCKVFLSEDRVKPIWKTYLA